MIARAFPVLLIAAIASGDAAADDVDPAAFACSLAAQASVRDRAAFQAESAAIAGNAVTVRYRAGDERGELRCAFVLDDKGHWKFNNAPSAALHRCYGVNDMAQKLLKAGEMKAAKRLKPDLEQCLLIQKAALVRASRHVVAASKLILEGAYPIASSKTALTPR